MVALCIVLTILMFLTLDYAVERAKAAKSVAPAPERKAHREPERAAVAPASGEIADARPAGFLLAPGHVWAELTHDGSLWLGLDQLAAGLLGAPDEIAIVPAGTRVARGAPVAAVRRGGRTLSMRAPFDGTVAEINTAAAANPRLLLVDPYGAGRFCRVAPDDLEQSLRVMRAGGGAREWMRQELARLRDALAEVTAGLLPRSLGGTLADGGPPIEGVASHLDARAWERIAAVIGAHSDEERAGSHGERPS